MRRVSWWRRMRRRQSYWMPSLLQSSVSSTFLLCTVPSFLGKVSDLVKWGFFVWMGLSCPHSLQSFFPYIQVCFLNELSLCGEVLVFTVATNWRCVAPSVSTPRTRWETLGCCGKSSSDHERLSFTLFVLMSSQCATGLRDAGAGRLKLPRET